MNNVIKRPKVGWESSDNATRQSLDHSILPSWYDEVQEYNRFHYRFNSVVKGWISELSREQLLLISQFALHTADITKPYFVTKLNSPSALLTGTSRRQITQNEDDLYSDVFRHALRIKDLGEEYKAMYSTLQTNIADYKHIEITDILAADKRTDIKQKIVEQLLPGEFILGGELVSATSLGRVINTDVGEITSQLERVEQELNRDSGYFCVPLLADRSTYKFFDVDDNLLDFDPELYTIGFSSQESLYNPDYDIDQDGYVSQEDINFIRNSVGRSLDNTSRDEWAAFYHRLDKDNDSLISNKDVAIAEFSLHGVLDSCILVKKPIAGYCKLVFEAYQQPYITYARANDVVRGGTFGYTLKDFTTEPRLSDGIYTNTSDMIIGFNRQKGEIWTGKLIEDQYELQKISFAQQSRMTAVGMTVVDEVCFFLLQSTLPTFRYFGSRYAILRVDTRKEKVEISNDLITFGVEIKDDQVLTGIQSTSRKDIFRVFTDDNEVITIKLIRNSILFQSGETFITQGSEQLVPSTAIQGYQRIYNDIDNFAFNFGMTRLLFESNEDFIKRVEIKGARPPGNSAQGMHSNYSLDLGIYEPILYRDIYVGTSNPISTNRSVRLVFQDLDFQRYPIQVITLHSGGDAVLKTQYPKKNIFLNGAVQVVGDASRAETYYELESEDWIEGNTLILRNKTIQRISEFLTKGNVENLLNVPNHDEDLICYRDISFRVMYSTVDPDGVEHATYDNFVANISSIDLASTSEIREAGEVAQIHPNSKTAKYIPRTYSMTKGITKDFVGSLWNKRIDKIRLGDTANWGKTIFGVTPFDDRFNSTYVVDKTLFNTGDFSQEQEEVLY